MKTIQFLAIGLFIASNLAFYTGVVILLFKSAKGLK